MIVDIVMPKLGESITEGTIIKWLKKVGETIQKDEILLEIGTDKVDSEIPSLAGGVVVEILSQPNDVVPVNEIIARIDTELEAATEAAAPEPAAPPLTPPEKTRTFYTPLVRAIARTEGVPLQELATIPGTGRGGRVSKKDILAYLERRRVAPEIEIPILEAPPVAAPGIAVPAGEEVVEMDRIRQLIAGHMRKSLDTAAHTHLMSECDVTRIADSIRQEQSDFQRREGFKLTYTPFFVLAAVKTIRDFPIFNTSVDGARVHYRRNINMGMAVATEKGLMVPVIRNCEELNFLGICRKVNDFAIRTRDGKISPGELQDSTFSITNYGVFGNLFGTPIINQPNTAILGIGTVTKRPVVRETDYSDAIVIRSMVYLSLGFDHRLIDGAGAGRFLQRMVDYLEKMDLSSLL